MSTTRHWRTLLVITLAGLVLPIGVGASAAPATADDAAAKIDDSVRDEVAEDGSASFWVVLDSEADLSGSKLNVKAAKARSVRAAKTRHAAETQAGLRALLDEENAEYESFWISNAILVKGGDAELLDKIGARPEVASVEPDEPIVLPEPVEGTTEAEVDGVEWGVDRINAPRVWDEFGVRGEDVVVASIDTGAQFDHPALVNQYRGNDGDSTFTHDYNFFDPANICAGEEPCDNHGHGTHTMGTMVGDDGAGNQVGVAPGATWIAAKGCETNSCSDAALLSAGQWIIAPTDLNGQNPRPELAPDVVNNSWSGGSGDFWYQDVVDSWVAAGIFPSFANGNSGPSCGTSGSPGDYPNSYSSGAFDIDNQIAPFSSRGAGPDGEIKPNLAAPGVNVRSTWPGDGYNAISGTSMATPHTTATVALMWSAAPSLRGDVAATREILDQTAIDTPDDQCGGTADDNNVWGEGRLDALAGVEQSPRGDLGGATGHITDSEGEPLAGVTVTFDGPLHRVRTTDDDGSYAFNRLIPGDYTATVGKFGYRTVTDTVTVAADQITTAHFTLDKAPEGALHGTVTDGSGHGWPLHAKITIDSYPDGPIYTNPYTGDYHVDLPQGTYTLHVDPLYPGYQRSTDTLTVNADTTLDFTVPISTCEAPGYAVDAVVTEQFAGWSGGTAENGWTVVDNVGNGQTWNFDNPSELTPPSDDGDFASIDSRLYEDGDSQDSSLVSPVMDLSTVDAPVLRFDTDALGWRNADPGQLRTRVEFSVDGGSTWTTVWDPTQGPITGRIDIPIPQAASQADVQVRFHYTGVTTRAWWAVDNVTFGACRPAPGGLVAGVVSDASTGDLVNQATVTSDSSPSESAMTTATEDPNFPGGFYAVFSSHTGATEFSVARTGYQSTTASVDVRPDVVARKDWALKSGRLAVSSDHVSVTETLGEAVTREVTFTNEGDAPLHVHLGTQDGGSTVQPQITDQITDQTSADLGTTADSAWTEIADYPFPVWAHAIATDPLSGKVYSVGGFQTDQSTTDKGYVYNPSDDAWTPIASVPEAVADARAAFIGGTLYLVGGVRADGTVSDRVYSYNTGSDRWSRAANLPAAVALPGSAVLNGQLYVIGGCTRVRGDAPYDCLWEEPRRQSVYRYDPHVDDWTQVSDYPVQAAEQACAGIRGLVVCAGGQEPLILDDTYLYDPRTDTWSKGADTPIRTGRMAYAGAHEKLQIVGGSNYPQEGAVSAAWEYDPATNVWSSLPDSTYGATESAGSCGFYHVGGVLRVGASFVPKQDAEVLAGYDICDGAGALPWLSVDDDGFELAPGESLTVKVTLDSAQVDQPGAYQAMLYAATNSPQPVQVIRVAMTVHPPSTWSLIRGTVTDGQSQPLARATVAATPGGPDSDGFAIMTDADGHYQWWLPSRPAVRLRVSGARDGYQPEAKTVRLVRGKPTNASFSLLPDPPESPDSHPSDRDETTSTEKAATNQAGKSPSRETAASDSVEGWPENVGGTIRRQIAENGRADFWVVLKSDADLSGAEDRDVKADKARSVRAAKTRHAAETQAGLRALLDLENVKYKAFWITNAILVRHGDKALLDEIASWPEVKSIEPDKPIELPEPQKGTREAEVNGVEWGVDRINAPRVWDEFGVRGEDIVVANIDTGALFDHPALVNQYRGNNGDGTFTHDYNWFNPTRPSPGPFDINGHGTHTMGTMVGDDGAGNQVGVAPGAEWIAARGCESDSCSAASLLSAGQWIVAPTDLNGQNPRPDLAPDVVNNSWSGGSGDFWYQDVVDSWVAAGIFPSFANGNSGPNCGTAQSPGDYPNTYSSGAFDIDNQIAPFSSRGAGPNGEIKPNIAAPGVNVRSTWPWPGDGYNAISGTSMATPHTTATVALMWSAAPSLRGDVAATEEILDQTAIDTPDDQCGGTAADNNVWGEGRLDAFAAVQQSPRGDVGAATGQVTDTDGSPLAGATVIVDGPLHRVRTTGDDGSYSFDRLIAGDYQVTVGKFGYITVTDTVTVTADQTTTTDFTLDKAPEGALHGTVTDGSGHGWPLHAKITIDGYPDGPIYTNPYTGDYHVDLYQDTYTLHIDPLSPGYQTTTETVPVDAGDTTRDLAATVVWPDCTAPGYSRAGIFEQFTGWEAPRDGWEVDNKTTAGWGFVSDGLENTVARVWTQSTPMDTSLITPTVDLSHVDEPVLRFRSLWVSVVPSTVLDVDLSVDGGGTWENFWRESGQGGGDRLIEVPIPNAAKASNARIRFHFIGGGGIAGWAVDDVLVGSASCPAVPGGLVAGVVTDANTGDAVNGARVANVADPDGFGISEATADPNLPDGFYTLFSSPAGSSELSATAGGYQTATASLNVPADAVMRQDWQLGAGRLSIAPGVSSATVTLGETVTREVTFTNDGSAPLHVTLGRQRGEYTRVGAPAGATSHSSERADSGPAAVAVPVSSGRGSASATESDWTKVAAYPFPVRSNAVAYDAYTGTVYSVGGAVVDGFTGLEVATAKAYSYNPEAAQWTRIADVPQPLRQANAAFLNGTLYVFGGWDAAGTASAAVYAYHPTSDRWTQVADLPEPRVHASSAVLGGHVYVIGGCRATPSGINPCEDVEATDSVVRYNPGADAWTKLAAYPVTVMDAACGGIDGSLVCAGGVQNTGAEWETQMSATHIYDPSADTWTQGADMPYDALAMGYSAANGRLQVFGGRGGSMLRGLTFARADAAEYDLATNTWRMLPSLPVPTVYGYGQGGSCGLYAVGGGAGGWGALATTDVWTLPGYGHCDDADRPAWLSAGKEGFDLKPGQTVTVTLTTDSAKVQQPGTYTATLWARANTPYPIEPSAVSVTMEVKPPSNWSLLHGKVTDSDGHAIRGATVQINSGCNSVGKCSKTAHTVKTDLDGHYQRWLPEKDYPLQIIAAKDHYVQQLEIVETGQADVVDFSLPDFMPSSSPPPAPVTFDDLRERVEAFEADGDVTKAGAKRLLAAVDQAERHHERGADDRAITVLERFKETASDARYVPSEIARDALIADADRLIGQLRAGFGDPGGNAVGAGTQFVPV